MDCIGHKLLACTAFSPDEHGGIAGGNMIDHFKDLSHFIAAAHDVVKAIPFFELFSKG